MEETLNFLPEEWPSNPDDFMDLFQLNPDMLFSEGAGGGNSYESGGINDITSSLISNLQNGFNYGDPCASATDGTDQAMSPMSSLCSDQEFHGFPNSSGTSLDGSSYEDDFIGGSPSQLPSQPSAVKMEVDEAMNQFSAFELNATDRLQQEAQQQLALSSAASDSGLSSDHLDLDPATDYEALSPALSSPGPSISERGGQNSPPRYTKSMHKPIQKPKIIVQQQPAQSLTVPVTTSLVAKASNVYQTVKSVVTGGSSQPKKAAMKPAQLENDSAGFVAGKDQLQTTHLANGKEVKIYRVAPMKSGQTVSVASGMNANKKFTLQLKNGTTPAPGTKTNGTVFINNKSVVVASSNGSTPTGVRKIIRVQQQQQQNGRSILVPVSIQDLRTIKIINPANLKNKSANIKLAAANLLQQSKQGLIQKNVVLTKEQLIVDDSDTAQNSDNESYIFEDIMQQSNSVIEQVERRQKHPKSQPIISDSDAELDQDDDLDMDDSSCTKESIKNANGGYQKLVLTTEEKRLLAKEGISLPTSYPLTKHEERELKRIRRKIRNKISAQDSRKRKKEYVDGLEERVKQCTEENQTLLKRIKILQSQNHDLMSQMKKIQSLLTKGTGKTTQPATCLMVLLLSMALVAVPNLRLGGTHQQQNIQDSIEMAELLQDAANDKTQGQTLAQNRRSLLFDTKEQLGDALVDEEMNFDEIMSFNMNSLIASEHDYSSEGEPKTKKPKTSSLVEYDVDDEVWNGRSKIRIKLEHENHSNAIVNKKSSNRVHDVYTNNKCIDQSSGFNIKSEIIVDSDLLEGITKQRVTDLYDNSNFDVTGGLIGKGGDTIELLSTGVTGSAPGTVEDVGRKLNASQQIQQQNSKRKLLL